MRARPARVVPFLLAFVLGLGAAGLAACGGKANPAMIPAANADQLRSDLDAVLSAIDSHDCTASDRAVAQVKSDLLELPSGTSQRLQDRLREGVDTLSRQAAKECEATTETTATTEPATTETVPTATTAPPPTTPPTTDTTPPPTTPTTTPTTPTPTTPPDDTGGAVVTTP